MRNITISLIFLLLCASQLLSQSEAIDLLNKSIYFHDPNGNWEILQANLDFEVERPGKPNGERKVFINNKESKFSFWAKYEYDVLNYEVLEDKGIARWNGVEEIADSLVKKYRISPERAVMYRDYYTYLYGMPMKLKDKGAIIHDKVETVIFFGKSYHRIKVTYEPTVGDDIWYFYFHPQTAALEAYQFFHDESKNDGEYILFEELKEVSRIKIPRIRKWYYNKDSTYLAADILK